MIRHLLLAAGALLPCSAAMAAEHAAEKAGGGGMPQLNIPDFAPQLFWLAIMFVILYVLMSRIGLPRVAGAIEARRQRREDDLTRAARLRSDAEAASAAYQKALSEARAEAQSTLKNVADRMAADSAERQRALATTLAEQIAAAERRIADSKQQALGEIRGVAVDVGRSVVEKLLGTPPDAARMSAAVDSTLAGQRP